MKHGFGDDLLSGRAMEDLMLPGRKNSVMMQTGRKSKRRAQEWTDSKRAKCRKQGKGTKGRGASSVSPEAHGNTISSNGLWVI